LIDCKDTFGGARSTNVRDEKTSVVKHNGEKRNLVDLDMDVRMLPQFWKCAA